MMSLGQSNTLRAASPSSSLPGMTPNRSMSSAFSRFDPLQDAACDSHLPPTAYNNPPSIQPVLCNSSPATMGQYPGRGQSPLLPLPQPPASAPSGIPSSGPLSAGQKLKRALAGRRKKSQDATKAITPQPVLLSTATDSSRERPRLESIVARSISSANSSSSPYPTSPGGRPSGAKQLTLQLASTTLHAFTGKKGSISSSAPPTSPPPPPLPPKPFGMKALPSKSSIDSGDKPLSIKPPLPAAFLGGSGKRGSVMPMSPTINPALAYMQSGESTPRKLPGCDTADATQPTADVFITAATPTETTRPRETSAGPERNVTDMEDRRKSDATVRLVGNSSASRPVSFAESSHSGHTVVPSNTSQGRRLSAMLTDAGFATPEELSDDDDDMHSTASQPLSESSSSDVCSADSPRSSSDADSADSPRNRLPVPYSPAKANNRRSLSLNLSTAAPMGQSNLISHPYGTLYGVEAVPFQIQAFGGYPATSSTTDLQGTVKAPLNITTPSSSLTDAQTGGGVRGRLAVWGGLGGKASSSQVSLSTASSSSHKDSPTQPPTRRSPSPGKAFIAPRGLCQTAISMTNGLAPAAGLAMGIGKRAVDRLGRAWGGSNSSMSSGYSSSSSAASSSPSPSAPPSSFLQNAATNLGLGRVHSNQSAPGNIIATAASGGLEDGKRARRKHRVTPGGHSGAWSMSSGTASDSDAPSAGPNLGKLIRPALRPGAIGLVFGRDLAQCVRDTATVQPRKSGGSGGDYGMGMEVVGVRALEDRQLPAVVLRCAQHLEKWGIQEEGLFRIPGRNAHVSKLRAEFDSGADYDMSESGPGDLDAHAVASIFKAYLRELPEPIVTRKLTPYFEAALSAESNAIATTDEAAAAARGPRGPSLPSGPRLPPTALRKPPSLSTFALPTLSTRAPSQNLLNTLAVLISKLPIENRDLLRTVTELIKATAKRSKETKMPMSNLLLVFCPSLSMSPPMLRVLCEGEGIWNGPPKGVGVVDPVVVDTKRNDYGDGVVLDIKTDSPSDGLAGPPTPMPTHSSMAEKSGEQAREEKRIKRESLGLGSLSLGPRSATVPVRSPVPEEQGREERRNKRESFGSGFLDLGPQPRGAARRVAAPPLRAGDDNLSGSPPPECFDQAPQSAIDRHPPSWVAYDDNSGHDAMSSSESIEVSSVTSSTKPSSAYDSHSPPPLTSSSESSDDPSHQPPAGGSPVRLPSIKVFNDESRKTVARTASGHSLPAHRQTMYGAPIHFPTTGSAPATPLAHRSHLTLSTYSTSSPDLTPLLSPDLRRAKRPSLPMLFRKASVSSLLSHSQTSPRPKSSQSPQSTISDVPPVLDMTIEHSSFSLGLGMDSFDHEEGIRRCLTENLKGSDLPVSPSLSDTTLRVSISPLSSPEGYDRRSTASSRSPTVYYTPTSRHRPLDPNPSQASFRSTGSSYSFLDVDIDSHSGSEMDDWAASILMAADATADDGTKT